MTRAMKDCADEIRSCWIQCDAALQSNDVESANDAFARVFELVDTFAADGEEDVKTLAFLCILTWVKVSLALEAAGQLDPALEAQQQVFDLLDSYWALGRPEGPARWPGMENLAGLESEQSAELVGRLYLLCSQHGREDTLYWGRCFMDFDRKARGGNELN